MFASLYGNRDVDYWINSYLEQLPNEAQRPVGRPRKPNHAIQSEDQEKGINWFS